MFNQVKLLFVILFVFFLSSCAGISTTPPSHTDAEIIEERKKQKMLVAEEKLNKQIREEQKLIDMKARLLRVSKPISKAALKLCKEFILDDNKLCIYKFKIDDKSRVVNASADGKNIIVTKPMMRFAKKDDELAIVLGHEAAHNIMGHVSKMRTNMTTGAVVGHLFDAIAESQGFDTRGLFSESGASLGAYRYSVDFEEEADYVGLYITYLAGYNIDKAPDFWRKMSVRNPEAIFADTTHPSNPKRFIALSKTVKEIYRKRDAKVSLLPDLKKEEG